MKPLDGRHLKNARGSAFVQALAAIAVVGILLYWLSPRVIKHREQVVKTASIITARLALHSMLDYTLLGIKQRWCFSESWMPESCGKNTTEILSHPRSVERILMKGDTVTFLRTMGLIKAGQNVDLDSISTTINIQNFTSLHPVYRIIADLKSVKVSSIKTTISRARKGLVPEYGREVYLQVTVQLLNEAGVPLQVGSSKLEATSFVGVYPREVGSFALLVPGDLHLDSKSSSGGKDGDLYIKNFSSRADFEKSSSGGLIFDSPVFVNGNLVLPKDQADASGDTNYTPVSFKEKVILGDGVIMRDGDEFKPRPTVDYEQFWTSIREFGGFLKGVDVDGSRDLGLDVLAGKSIPGSGDVNLMQMCIRRTQAMNDLSKTANSKLYGRLQNQLGKKFDYRLGMDFLNRFTRQRGQAEAPNANYRNLLVESKSKIKGENGAIASYRLEFGDLKVTGDLPDNGSVSIAPKVDLRPLENSLTSATSRLRDSISDLGGDISRLQSQIRSLQDDIGDAQNALEAEKRKTTPDASKISNLNSRISSLRDSVQNKQDSIAEKKASITDAENKLSSSEQQLALVRSNMNLQPVINMKMDVPNPDKGSNPSFKDFHVSFENGEVLVDSMGNPLPIKIYLQAYDVGYDQGNSLRSNWRDMQTNGWIVFNRQGVGFVASNTVLDARGASRGDLPEGDINQDVDGVCANVGTSSSTAFGGVDWLTSFAGNARHSWSFTNSYDSRTNYTFNSGNASLAAKTATFVIKSTARVCTIESTADFVAGFLVCDELVIAPRTTKLRIVGSMIVMKKLIIADEALKAGIRWSTIYQPMATFELRQAGVLVGQNGVACDSINRFPVWHPVPSITDVSNLYRCNAIALRSKADPFRWTSVDPDCGLVPNANSTKCKGHMVNFFVLEVSRESGI